MTLRHSRSVFAFNTALIALVFIAANVSSAQSRGGYYVPELLRRQFNQYDTDRNGALSQQEASTLRWPFAEVDANSDGGITFDEADAYLRRITSGRSTRLRRAVRPADPFAEAPFRRHPNIAYAPQMDANNDRLKLDLYTPRQDITHADWNVTAASRPIVVFVHGGAWAIGDKALVGFKMPLFTMRGCLFASVNYRFVPEGLHPTNAGDVARAVAWLADHATEYGGDPNRIVLIGHSAGAHLVSLVAANPAHLSKAGVDPAAIKAVISLDTEAYDLPRLMADIAPAGRRVYTNAFTEDADLWADASPITHIDTQRAQPYPAFLLFTAGSVERHVTQAQAFAARLEAAGAIVKQIDYPNHTHTTLNRTLGRDEQQTTQDMIDFLNTVLTMPGEDTNPDPTLSPPR